MSGDPPASVGPHSLGDAIEIIRLVTISSIAAVFVRAITDDVTRSYPEPIPVTQVKQSAFLCW